MQRNIKKTLKILPFAIILFLAVLVFLTKHKITVNNVLASMPDNIFLACAFMLGLYALKSLTLVFPIIILQIACGLYFPFWTALWLNIFGAAIGYTVPYLIGRFLSGETVERLIKKHPKIENSVKFQKNSIWFSSFILRAVSCLPCDIVSLYFGTVKAPYLPYVTASVIGTLPGLIPATVAGVNMLNPKSAPFIISITITALTSVTSILIYRRVYKNNM